MNPMLLTKDTTFIIGPVATILGYLMNAIFIVLDAIHIPSTGFAIIIFTIVIYLCLLPLTIRQQKFSKLTQKMQPEINKIQNKYKGRSDQESQMKMSEETQAVYAKYGVSPMGSCVQLLIQMPILFALYRVIYNIPAYVTKVKDAFYPLVTNLIAQSGSAEYLQETSSGAQFSSRFTSDNFINNVGDTVANVYIDVLNRFSTSEWTALSEQFSELTEDINSTLLRINEYNNFFGLNIGNSPWYTFKQAIAAGSVLAIIGAVSVPVLAALTQMLNVALTPQSGDAKTQSSMRTMNIMMPLMSAWFCFTLPAGMGLYWIAGAVIRSVQQVVINRYMDKIDMDAYLKKQEEKARKKREKKGDKKTSREKMYEYANMNTRGNTSTAAPRKKTLGEKAGYQNRPTADAGGTGAVSAQTAASAQKKYKEGSLAQKAHLVETYNNAEKGATGRTSRVSRSASAKKTTNTPAKKTADAADRKSSENAD